MNAGEKYGYLTVVKRASSINGFAYVVCKCACGAEIVAKAASLRAGFKKSCGCMAAQARRTHGLSKSPEYKVWANMHRRCDYEKHSSFPHYGGSGINVCKRWKSFANFYEDMGQRPSGMTLERIKSTKGYMPNNCIWATHTEQMNNRSNNVRVVFAGENKTLAEWARDPRCVVSRHTLGHRVKRGWKFETALATPSRLTKSSST